MSPTIFYFVAPVARTRGADWKIRNQNLIIKFGKKKKETPMAYQFGIHMLAKFECGGQVERYLRRNTEILCRFVTISVFRSSPF